VSNHAYPTSYREDESFARGCDQSDPLADMRLRFHMPCDEDGRELAYFAGNSLGLQPRATDDIIRQELQDWASLGVDGHFRGTTPWYSYHEVFRECGSRLVGANPGEVVVMNSLTVNLHLMMVSFYRPTPSRHKIVIEDCAFPSDTYAVKSQLRHHGFDPEDGLIVLRPREGETLLRTADIVSTIERQAEQIALVMLAGVNYFTGQAFDMQRITKAARDCGCVVGWDLAHAAGNLVLRLHDWDVDFAAWCNYKYLNSGPGAVASCFVHERHGADTSLSRFAGWWGNDPDTRFRMHLEPDFKARQGADGWQISNPPILAMAPVKTSYEMFDEVTMPSLREKSESLTGYLLYLLDTRCPEQFQVFTPREADRRGCQVSIAAAENAEGVFDSVQRHGIVCDFRKPNVIRVAPVPLYNSFHDVWRLVDALAARD
jgi:kynureninase